MTLNTHSPLEVTSPALPVNGESAVPHLGTALTLKDVLLMIYRRRRLAAGVAAAILLTVGLVTVLMPSIYVARTQILLKRERVNNVVSVKEGTETDAKTSITEEIINSEIEILKSTTLMREVLRSNNLYQRLLADKGTKPMPDSLGLEVAVAILKKELECQPVPKSNIIQVRLEARDPHLATELVNTVGQRYVDRHLEVHESRGIYAFFQKQAEALQDTLQTTAAALRVYETEHGLVDPEQQRQLILQQLADYETRLSSARASALAAARQVAFLENQIATTPARLQEQSREISETVYEALQRELDTLRLKYEMLMNGEETVARSRLARGIKARIAQVEERLQRAESAPNPEVSPDISRTMLELSSELTRSRFNLIGAQTQEKELQAGITELQGRLRKLEHASLTHETLKRQWSLQQNNYLLYAKKQEEARISEALDREKVANVTIIDPATVPLAAARPNRKLNLGLGMMLALLCGLGAAVGAGYFDTLIRGARDLERQLEIPLLAAIPEGQWPPELVLQDGYDAGVNPEREG